MKFSTVILATASLLAAGVVNAAPAPVEPTTEGYTPIGEAPVHERDLQKRTNGGVYVCQAYNWGAPCAYWVLGWNQCNYVNPPWWNTISSVGPDAPSTWCVLYTSTDCTSGASPSIGPGGGNLVGSWLPWNDNVRSIKCWW